MGNFVRLNQLGPVNVATSLTTIGVVGGTRGAKAVWLEVFGGSNSANDLAILAGVCCSDLEGTLVPVGDITLTASAVGRTNRAEGAGLFVSFTATTASLAIPTDFVQIKAQMATAVSNGCRFNVWAEF